MTNMRMQGQMRKTVNTVGLLMSLRMAGVLPTALYTSKAAKIKDLKNCANKLCKNEHSHNNSFCSAECAKVFKESWKNLNKGL